MKTTATLTILLAPLLALAQGPNAFKFPGTNLQGVAAGKPLDLQWTPSTGGTVSLILRAGNSGDLSKGMPIASNIQNSGSYTWSVPQNIPRSGDYTIEIVADGQSGATNFTPQFPIDSTNTAPATSASGSSSSSSASSTSSMPSSTSSGSSSSSSSASMTSSSSRATSSASSTSSSSRAPNSSSASASPAASTTAATTNGGPVVQAGSWGMVGALLAAFVL